MEMMIAVFAILLALILILFVESRREMTFKEKQADLDAMYAEIWTGSELDRVYAWYRVIAHLEAWKFDPEMIAEANRRLNALKEDRISDSYVSVKGRAILRREVS